VFVATDEINVLLSAGLDCCTAAENIPVGLYSCDDLYNVARGTHPEVWGEEEETVRCCQYLFH